MQEHAVTIIMLEQAMELCRLKVVGIKEIRHRRVTEQMDLRRGIEVLGGRVGGIGCRRMRRDGGVGSGIGGREDGNRRVRNGGI